MNRKSYDECSSRAGNDLTTLNKLNLVASIVLCQELYVGCYKTFIGSGLPSNINPIQSVSQCLTKCRSQAPLFAAVKVRQLKYILIVIDQYLSYINN